MWFRMPNLAAQRRHNKQLYWSLEALTFMRPGSRLALAALAAILVIAACDSGRGVGECTATMANIQPDSAVIAVGDTVTLSLISLTGSCLPSDTSAAVMRWIVPVGVDTGVVHVDSLSGLVTGLAPGKTHIQLMTQGGPYLGHVPVTVTP